jgi:catechol 2,3-dioxygenase-like lactoylglutathione lyase family enzyme
MPGEAGSYERWHDVLCISEVGTDNLKKARQYFTEVFGMRADGKEVDRKIQQLFDEACNRWIDGESVNTTVAVPIELILAITLREGFNRKTGRQKKSPYRRHNLESAVRWAKRRATELRQNGMRRGPAKEQAIKEAEQQQCGQRVDRWFYGTDASTIRDNWSKIV